MELPQPIVQLIQEIFAHRGPKAAQRAKENPVACLTSLLLEIKRMLPQGTILEMAVEWAAFEQSVEEAQQFLKEATKRT